LQRIPQGTADVTQVLGQAQSVDGWMGKLGLTDLEVAFVGLASELLGDYGLLFGLSFRRIRVVSRRAVAASDSLLNSEACAGGDCDSARTALL
jgi:hypothetical protein